MLGSSVRFLRESPISININYIMETLSSLLTPNDFKFINEYNALVKKAEESKPFLFMSNYREKKEEN